MKLNRVTVRWCLPVCIILLLAISCDDDEDGAADEGAPQAASDVALVVTSDYETGSYATVGLADRRVNRDIAVIHSDAVCHYDQATGLAFLILRWGADSINLLDADDGLKIVREYSVGAGTNPQDIALASADRAFVSLYASPEMLIVHPAEGTVLGRIDLAAYADSDGLPELSGLLAMDGKLYAAVQRLDPAFLPAGTSSILVIDAAAGAVEEEVVLAAANPAGDLRYAEAIDRLVIIETGAIGVKDGGIELFDPSGGGLSGLVITEQALGGDVIDAVIVSATKGYAIVGRAEGESSMTDLVAFDPSTGELSKTLLSSDEWAYSALAITPDGSELWVADRTMDNPGVRIFSVATDAEATGEPIYVGLPPTGICFVE